MTQRSDSCAILKDLVELKYGIHDLSKSAKLQGLVSDLKKLQEEFDTLGVPAIQTSTVDLLTVVDQLIQSSYMLIQMYRKKLKEVSNFQLFGAKQETLQLKLNEDINTSKSKLAAREDEINKLKHELFKIKCECDEKNNLNKSLIVQLTQTKAAYKAKIKEHDHTVHQLQNQIETLKEKCGESIGHYKSSGSFISEYLLKYKNREEIYRETIGKLQENNSVLMEEILNLKQEVILNMSNGDSLLTNAHTD